MTGLTLLVSYPKSGNTWLRAFLSSVACAGGPVDINRLEIRNAADRNTTASLLGIAMADFSLKEEIHLRRRALEYAAQQVRQNLLFKVHDAMLPVLTPPVLPFPEQSIGAVVYIVRDPRDVAVSFANHLGRTIDDTIRMMASPKYKLVPQPHGRRVQMPQLLSAWSSHVRSWLDRPGLNTHLMRYEDLHADPVGRFASLLRFLGLAVPDEVLTGAVRATSFSVLRAQELEHGFVERPRKSKEFFRRGVTEGWRDTLTREQADRIVADHGTVMRELGYPAPTALAAGPDAAFDQPLPA